MDACARVTETWRRPPKRLVLWIGLCAAGLLIAMAGPPLAGRVYTRDDLGAFHLPIRAFYARQLARGEAFDWMPELFCGFDLTGEGQAGTYHPVHLLLYQLLPLEAAWPVEVLLSYPFMLAGTWLFLRRSLGRADAAAFGALAFTFCGFNLLHFVHPNAIAIVAHIPWLLWALDVALMDPDARDRRAARIAVALLTGSQLLLGYPQYVWFSLVAEAAWGTVLLVRGGRVTWAPLAWLAGAKATGLLLGAVQLLPTVEALGLAARRVAGSEFANSGSLHPWNLVQLVSPYFFPELSVGITPHEAGVYLGAVPLVLLVWLRTHPRAGRRLPGSGLVALLGLGALFLAFGPAGQIYRLQQFLPLVSNFRCPCRYLLLFQMAMIFLAAAGFGELASQCRRRQKSSWRDLRGLAVLLAVAVAVALAGFVLSGHPLIASRRYLLAGAALVSAAAGLTALAARAHRWALPGLVLLAALDLGVYGMPYAVYRDTEPLAAYARTAMVPPGPPDVRVAADLLAFGDQEPRSGNQMLLGGWSRVDGYAGLEPARRLDYRQVSALRVAVAGWVRRWEQTESLAGLLARDKDWFSVPNPLPYVRLVSKAEVSADPKTDLPRIPIETTVLVERPVDLPDGEPGTVWPTVERPGRLAALTDAPAERLLCVAESFHPGWRASVDGRPAEVLRVNGDFLGCLVDGGKHRVSFEFRPRSLGYGLAASLSGLALVMLSGVILVVQSQRRLV